MGAVVVEEGHSRFYLSYRPTDRPTDHRSTDRRPSHGHSRWCDSTEEPPGLPRSPTLGARPGSLTRLRRTFTSGKWCTRDDGQWPPAKSDRHSPLLFARSSRSHGPGVVFRDCARKMTLSCRLGGRALCKRIKRAVDAAKTPTTGQVDARSSGQTCSSTCTDNERSGGARKGRANLTAVTKVCNGARTPRNE